jgi:hypothetical protein
MRRACESMRKAAHAVGSRDFVSLARPLLVSLGFRVLGCLKPAPSLWVRPLLEFCGPSDYLSCSLVAVLSRLTWELG